MQASLCIEALSELRRTGSMYDIYGPFRSVADAHAATISNEDMVDAGLTPDEIDWSGFAEAGDINTRILPREEFDG